MSTSAQTAIDRFRADEVRHRAEQRAADARYMAEKARLQAQLDVLLALLFPMYHVYKPDPCRGIAFYTTRRLADGDVLDSSTVRMADGAVPIDGETDMVCGACGQYIGVGSVAYEAEPA